MTAETAPGTPDSGYPLGWESVGEVQSRIGGRGLARWGVHQARALAEANRGKMAPKGRPARVMVDGVGLAYHEHGQGRPLVLVHGLAACSASWHETASLLSRDFRCIAVDLMGFGHSDKPVGESYTLERQAELLQLFLVELALEDAVLIGHSYGGGVCLSALREPCPRVSALVLVDSICYPQPAPIPFRLLGFPVLGPLALYLVPKSWVAGAVFGNAYGDRTAPAPELVAANALALASASGRHALIQTVRALVARPIEPLANYSRLSLPTLIIWGRRDRLVPIALGQQLASEIPGVKLAAFDTCGHLPQEESPRETAEVIARFVGEMPSGPTGSYGRPCHGGDHQQCAQSSPRSATFSILGASQNRGVSDCREQHV